MYISSTDNLIRRHLKNREWRMHRCVYVCVSPFQTQLPLMRLCFLSMMCPSVWDYGFAEAALSPSHVEGMQRSSSVRGNQLGVRTWETDSSHCLKSTVLMCTVPARMTSAPSAIAHHLQHSHQCLEKKTKLTRFSLIEIVYFKTCCYKSIIN